MGMGYGSSLPMSGYYHQMGPMSQVKRWSSCLNVYAQLSSLNKFLLDLTKLFSPRKMEIHKYTITNPSSQMTGQSSLYSGMSSMGAWGMAAGTMAAAGTGAIGSPSAHSAFGIGSGTAGTGQAQLPIGTSMVSFVDLFFFLWQLLKMPLFLAELLTGRPGFRGVVILQPPRSQYSSPSHCSSRGRSSRGRPPPAVSISVPTIAKPRGAARRSSRRQQWPSPPVSKHSPANPSYIALSTRWMTLAMMIHVSLDLIQVLGCVRDYHSLLLFVKERVACEVWYSYWK